MQFVVCLVSHFGRIDLLARSKTEKEEYQNLEIVNPMSKGLHHSKEDGQLVLSIVSI